MVFLSSLLVLLPVALAQVPAFQDPSKSPTLQSNNYVGKANTTLPMAKQVKGKAFDRIIIITMENTDFKDSASNPVFAKFGKEGVVFTNYFACGHPSEPNYVCQSGGDTFGMGDDSMHAVPGQIPTIVDLLEEGGVSWAGYYENLPTDGSGILSFASTNYLNKSAPNYPFYMRKHNQLIIYDSVATVPSRAARVRNFNDFAVDVDAGVLPQFMYMVPNMVNDGHDTNVPFQAAWLDYFLTPLMNNPNFNGPKTVILLTYDENGTGSINNNIFTMAIGNGVPKEFRGTTDDTFLTHFSELSTVQLNWNLQCLGRQDANKTMSNVLGFVAAETGYKNLNVKGNNIPLLNGTSATPGPFNNRPGMNTSFSLPNFNAKCASGRPVCQITGCPSMPLPVPIKKN